MSSASTPICFKDVEHRLIEMKGHKQIEWAFDQRCGDPAVKFTLLALTNRANSHGVSWPSQDLIAEEVEASVGSVRRYIERLRELGLVFSFPRYRPENRDGTGRKVRTSNHYILRCHLPDELLAQFDRRRGAELGEVPTARIARQESAVSTAQAARQEPGPNAQIARHSYDAQEGPDLTRTGARAEPPTVIEPPIEPVKPLASPQADDAAGGEVTDPLTDGSERWQSARDLAERVGVEWAAAGHGAAPRLDLADVVAADVLLGRLDLGDRWGAWHQALDVIEAAQDAGNGAPLRSAAALAERWDRLVRPRRGRKVDPLWDAVVAECFGDGAEFTDKARSSVNAALKELRGVGATPEQVIERAAAMRAEYGDRKVTPHSLASHWPRLGKWVDEQRRGVKPSDGRSSGSRAAVKSERDDELMAAARRRFETTERNGHSPPNTNGRTVVDVEGVAG